MVSGGVVYLPAADGNLYMFNADNGELLDKIFLSNSLLVLPTIGKTIDGEPRLFVISGGRGAYAIGGITNQNIPGAIFSFGLPDNYVAKINEDPVNKPQPVEEQIQKEEQLPNEEPKKDVKSENKSDIEEKKGEPRISESNSVDNYWFVEQFYDLLLGAIVIMIIGIFIIKIRKWA